MRPFELCINLREGVKWGRLNGGFFKWHERKKGMLMIILFVLQICLYKKY